MDLEIWAQTRRLHLREGLSRRVIAERLGVHRQTVARALAMERFVPPKRPKRGSCLDPFKATVARLRAEFPLLSAVRMLEELRKEGYRGSLTLLRDHLRSLRPAPSEVFARLHFEPGEACQVDWAACGVIAHEGVRRRLSAFLMTACHSRMLYAELSLSESADDFLRCHHNALRFFGGVFRSAIYDNTKAAVLFHLAGELRFNPRLLDFAGHFCFEPRACRPRRPQEKGRVESSVRYLRSSFLAGRAFGSLTEAQAEIVRWRDEVANVRVHRATGRRPVDLWEEEKPALRALPALPYDDRSLRTLRVSTQARVHFDSNTYSVPPQWVGATVTLRASPQELWLYAGAELIARHRRAWGRGVDVVDPQHEEALRARKRRVERSHLERDFRALSPRAGEYLQGLVRAAIQPFVHMRKILDLAQLYGPVEIAAALERALAHGAFGFEYVHNIVLQERRRQSLPPAQPLTLAPGAAAESHWPSERDLEGYDRLFESGDHTDANAQGAQD